MSSFPMAPLLRQSVGLDRFNDLFESELRNDTGSSYPPYNIEKHGLPEQRGHGERTHDKPPESASWKLAGPDFGIPLSPR